MRGFLISCREVAIKDQKSAKFNVFVAFKITRSDFLKFDPR
jgi:hypothetical protein